MTHVERAKINHQNGYNCAQAVFCAFSDLIGLDETTAYKISEGFGSGMGGQFETCGALTGAYMVLSMKNSDGVLGSNITRGETYALLRKTAAEFREKAGSTLCKEIKGMTGGKVLHSCPDCVADAAVIVATILGVE